MTTAVQVQYRRGSGSQVAAFTGAQGEMVVDTTNNRVVVQDGSTVGGWPAAKLDDSVVAFTGGTINGTTLGQTTPAAAAVTALGVGAATPGAGIVNVSGSYQVGGTQISAANLSDGTTGTGAIVKANAPAFTGNPTGITALGVNESTPGTGIINVSGSYQVGGSQISAANLSDGTTGTGAIVKANAPAFTGNPTGITALGVNESTPETGIINVSGSYQVGGSQISATNLSDGTTGTGAIVKAGSPTLTTPNLGTPSAATLTNATGLPIATGVSGLGTGVATALGNAANASGGPMTVVTGPTSWTPTDQSGAGLTFTNVSAMYCQYGNMVFVYGTLTYPSTASSANATISLPAPVPNQAYAGVVGKIAGLNLFVKAVPNTSTAVVVAGNGTQEPNSSISVQIVTFMLIYPAS